MSTLPPLLLKARCRTLHPYSQLVSQLVATSCCAASSAEENFIAAAAAGASQSIGLVANIAANLIAFLSLLAFVNWLLSWLGSLVDHPELSFEVRQSQRPLSSFGTAAGASRPLSYQLGEI